LTIVAFVAVLGILILIHDVAIIVAALWRRRRRFSVGFRALAIPGKQTEYCGPSMGGYVKMMGDDENPLEGGKAGTIDPAKAFNHKPLLARFLIVFAGPAMNFVLAVLIAGAMFMFIGRPVAPAEVGRVTEGGPAAQAGLRTGDRIAVDGKRCSTGRTCPRGPDRERSPARGHRKGATVPRARSP
jgi:regulator of sigma E protease